MTLCSDDTTGQPFQDKAEDQAAFVALLRRSHSSFQARPDSIHSSLRNSILSLDPSPPYALSLNGDARDEIKQLTEGINTLSDGAEPVSSTSSSPSKSAEREVLDETAVGEQDRESLQLDERTHSFDLESSSDLPAITVAESAEEDDMYGRRSIDIRGSVRDDNRQVPFIFDTLRAKAAAEAENKACSIRISSSAVESEAKTLTPNSDTIVVNSYSIAIAGSGDSGKTRLINTFLGDDLGDNLTRQDLTLKTCNVDETPVVVDIRHNTGQEFYSSMRDNYLSYSEGFLLIYNTSSHSSLRELMIAESVLSRMRDDRSWWGYPAILIAHNVGPEGERQVSHQEGQDLAKRIGCRFVDIPGNDHESFREAIYDMIRLLRKRDSQVAAWPIYLSALRKESIEPPLSRRRLRNIWTRKKA